MLNVLVVVAVVRAEGARWPVARRSIVGVLEKLFEGAQFLCKALRSTDIENVSSANERLRQCAGKQAKRTSTGQHRAAQDVRVADPVNFRYESTREARTAWKGSRNRAGDVRQCRSRCSEA